jgi:hypothetical protein
MAFSRVAFTFTFTCLLLLLFITCMQVIYIYIPETNHVSGVYSVATALYLQFIVQVILFFMLDVL